MSLPIAVDRRCATSEVCVERLRLWDDLDLALKQYTDAAEKLFGGTDEFTPDKTEAAWLAVVLALEKYEQHTRDHEC